MTEYGNLEAALKLANKWREASGQDILSAWLPSVVADTNQCLLARAFNRHCDVGYEIVDYKHEHYEEYGVGPEMFSGLGRKRKMRARSGYIEFIDRDDVEKFAEATGLESHSPESYSFILPDEIALVAFEFDHGMHQEYAIGREEIGGAQ